MSQRYLRGAVVCSDSLGVGDQDARTVQHPANLRSYMYPERTISCVLCDGSMYSDLPVKPYRKWYDARKQCLASYKSLLGSCLTEGSYALLKKK